MSLSRRRSSRRSVSSESGIFLRPVTRDGVLGDRLEAEGLRLIAGFQIGVNGMKVGGERVMSIPSQLGYGAQAVTDASGTVIIPANSTLLFDVKLIKVAQGTTTPASPGSATQ